ncbi:hypothetical protein GM418_27960 [Maribellus comscasis]|uniref:Uncharacterized protein n=1 Tax=Maribellus comscasis TaxID=2681766 RepID=A0A6I6KAY8_9BACT|nr:hypothetical protein [Maribellus comscasis]QGY47364.1 hypothetical protein GM418_27960 [Maribellus comscasis]
MKKLIILTLVAIFMFGTAQTIGAKSNKTIVGEWKFNSPSAPYGYDKGSIIISEKDGNLAGEIKFADGYKMDLKKVNFEENTFTCSLYVDYELVEIKAEIKGTKMSGNANSSGGKMPFTADKTK